MVTADLISRARAGDGDVFRELTEPHRRELSQLPSGVEIQPLRAEHDNGVTGADSRFVR